MEPSALLQQAFQLRKEKKHQEALAIYDPLWQQQPQLFGEYELWSYGQCLKEKRRYDDALDISRAAYRVNPASDYVRQLYGWCVYYTQIAGEQQPATYTVFKKAVDAIVQLCPPHQPYSPAVKSIFKMIKHLGSQPQIDWPVIQQWLNKMDVDKLSLDTYAVSIPGRPKQVELASEAEEWYSWQSKCYLQLGQWQACIDLCDKAEKHIDKWHYSNGIWFGRRKAAAMVQLGQKQEAEAILRQLLAKKREWFMLADLAAITTNEHEALALYAEAALAFGEPKAKVGMFFKMARLLAGTGQNTEAHAHAVLAMAVRQQSDWPIPAELETFIVAHGEMPGLILPASQLLSALRPFWQQLSGGPAPAAKMPGGRQSGEVVKVLASGLAGFIKPRQGGENVYFAFSQFGGNPSELRPGFKVTYEVVESFDAKKQQPSLSAIKVKKA